MIEAGKIKVPSQYFARLILPLKLNRKDQSIDVVQRLEWAHAIAHNMTVTVCATQHRIATKFEIEAQPNR